MNKGFSLVELIVVIAIMAILVGVAVPVYTNYITKANNNVDEQLVDDIDRAIEVCLIDPDVTNPKAGVTIVLDATTGKLSIVPSVELGEGDDDPEKTVNDAFLKAVQEIIDGSKLKGTTYQYGVTYKITENVETKVLSSEFKANEAPKAE